jgi:TonB family protein
MKVFWQQSEGQVVDGLPLRKYLGGGEDKAVFLTEYAADPARKAAIKLSHAVPESTEEQLRRWRLAAELSHPNLMRLFERGTWQLNKVPLLYVVTEYAEEDLSQVIPERALTVEEANEMLKPALEALAYLHSKGFVHGHLKPSNLLAVDGRLKISSDSVVQIGASPATPADDVWSLGMTLVEALTQQLPVWNAADAREPILPETLPGEFRDVARNMLRRDPRSRWTMAEIQQRLGGQQETTQRKRVSGAVVGTAAALILLAMGAGALRLHNRDSGSTQSPAPPAQTQAAPTPAPTAQAVPAPATTPVPLPPPPEPESKPAPAPPRASHGDVVEQIMPDVLPKARNSIHGKVTVNIRVDVDPSGNVSGTTLESPEASRYFGGAADKAARRWKFAPADVPRVWILRFEFTRAGTKVATVKATP